MTFIWALTFPQLHLWSFQSVNNLKIWRIYQIYRVWSDPPKILDSCPSIFNNMRRVPWDGSKCEPFSFSLLSNRNIDHVSKPRDGSKFESFCLEFNFCSNFEPSQDFRTNKSEPSQEKSMWSIFRAEIREKLNDSKFEPSQDYMPISKCDIWSFDGFLSHLRIPPVSCLTI